MNITISTRYGQLPENMEVDQAHEAQVGMTLVALTDDTTGAEELVALAAPATIIDIKDSPIGIALVLDNGDTEHLETTEFIGVIPA